MYIYVCIHIYTYTSIYISNLCMDHVPEISGNRYMLYMYIYIIYMLHLVTHTDVYKYIYI